MTKMMLLATIFKKLHFRWIGNKELFLRNGWQMKGVKPYFQPEQLSNVLTTINLPQAPIKIWTCAEPEFRLCWVKLRSSNNHYITVQQILDWVLISLCYWHEHYETFANNMLVELLIFSFSNLSGFNSAVQVYSGIPKFFVFSWK